MTADDEGTIRPKATIVNIPQATATSTFAETQTVGLSFGYENASTLLQQYKAVKLPDDHEIYALVGRVASCKRRSNNPSLKRPSIPVAPE
jgi:hypothetical protein